MKFNRRQMAIMAMMDSIAAQPAASETAIKAIAAADRSNGMLVLDLTNDVIWAFDSGSSASASVFVLVPDAGTGRWLRRTITTADLAAITVGRGIALVGVEDALGRFVAANGETVFAEVGARIRNAVANAAALQAVLVASAADGQIAVKLDDDTLWTFDAGSSAGASSTVIVPDAGSGRWLRKHPTLVELAATAGSALIGHDGTQATVKLSLDAKVATATLALTTGSALVGHDGAQATVKAALDALIGVVKRTVTIGHADLTDADDGDPQVFNIGATLPANARIAYVEAHTYTPFTGGTISAMALKIGSSGDDDAIIATSDLFAAAVDGGPATFTKGIRPNKLFTTIGAQLIATLTPTGDDGVSVTAGAITLDVYYFVSA